MQLIATIGVLIGILQAIMIVFDFRSRRQMMKIMYIVWPMIGLYFPIIGLWAYYKIGRKDSMKVNKKHDQMQHADKPFWQQVFVSTTHCSSGCALGDIIGAPIVFWAGLTIAGSTLYADFAVEFILAFLFGIVFQYYGMGMNKAKDSHIADAIKTDALSLIAFEIGMFGFMLLAHSVFFDGLHPNSVLFWFMMQIAMIIGFATSYPVNWIMVKKGMKHAM
ncbi:DUF4396 domain-containing protein [Terribacillus saccharophilus]|uniref:DUF4396 domain-containing protein n=1 Tax=Terribacillus saccharophilus TaxID=361277 RepID=UPI00380FA59E